MPRIYSRRSITSASESFRLGFFRGGDCAFEWFFWLGPSWPGLLSGEPLCEGWRCGALSFDPGCAGERPLAPRLLYRARGGRPLCRRMDW